MHGIVFSQRAQQFLFSSAEITQTPTYTHSSEFIYRWSRESLDCGLSWRQSKSQRLFRQQFRRHETSKRMNQTCKSDKAKPKIQSKAHAHEEENKKKCRKSLIRIKWRLFGLAPPSLFLSASLCVVDMCIRSCAVLLLVFRHRKSNVRQFQPLIMFACTHHRAGICVCVHWPASYPLLAAILLRCQ